MVIVLNLFATGGVVPEDVSSHIYLPIFSGEPKNPNLNSLATLH